jgi:alkaline phosphatase
VLDACFRSDGIPYGRENFIWTDTFIPEEELEWLEADLKGAKAPTIVLAHQRLDITGDYAVTNAKAVRDILETSGRVLAVLQGHNHLNAYLSINGIHYVTLDAIVEGSGPENGAYGFLELFDDGRLQIRGFRKQKSYTLLI